MEEISEQNRERDWCRRQINLLRDSVHTSNDPGDAEDSPSLLNILSCAIEPLSKDLLVFVVKSIANSELEKVVSILEDIVTIYEKIDDPNAPFRRIAKAIAEYSIRIKEDMKRKDKITTNVLHGMPAPSTVAKQFRWSPRSPPSPSPSTSTLCTINIDIESWKESCEQPKTPFDKSPIPALSLGVKDSPGLSNHSLCRPMRKLRPSTERQRKQTQRKKVSHGRVNKRTTKDNQTRKHHSA